MEDGGVMINALDMRAGATSRSPRDRARRDAALLHLVEQNFASR
jgi:hypothetical protein